MLITRLTAQLRCCLPEPADATWARLRQPGICRARLVAESVSQVQQMRDLPECAWPAVLDAARQPLESATWHAALTVALARADGDRLRHGALERVGLLLADWRDTQGRLAGTGQRMVTVLDELGLTELVTSITGLPAVGAASILAQTGDPRRFTSAGRWSSTPAWRRGKRAPAATPAVAG